jgi:hypothetical protein
LLVLPDTKPKDVPYFPLREKYWEYNCNLKGLEKTDQPEGLQLGDKPLEEAKSMSSQPLPEDGDDAKSGELVTDLDGIPYKFSKRGYRLPVDEFNVWRRSKGHYRPTDLAPRKWAELDTATKEAIRREYYESEARDDIVEEGADLDVADTDTGIVDGDVSTTAPKIGPRGIPTNGALKPPLIGRGAELSHRQASFIIGDRN